MKRSRFLLPLVLMTLPALTLAAQDETPASQPTKPEPPKIELIDAGAAPRTALRLTPAKGLSETIQITTGMSMSQSMGGMDMPGVDVPRSVITFSSHVTKVDENGDLHVDLECTEAVMEDTDDVDPMMAQAIDMMRDSLDSMAGLTGRIVMTNRGVTKESDFDTPEGMDAAMSEQMGGFQQNLSQLNAVFPEEEVGAGASWIVTNDLEQGGMKLKVVTTYEIVALDERGVTIKVKSETSAEPQIVDNPNVPEGIVIELESLEGEGSGRMVFLFGRLSASESTMESVVDVNMSVDMGGQFQEMGQHMEMKVEISSKETEG